MEIGDKVYALPTDTIEEIISIENYKKLKYIMKSKNDFYYDELLCLKQCAYIFTNKKLEQLVLNNIK